MAPAGFPDIPGIAGVSLEVAETGLRYRGRDDLLLATIPADSAVAGVFTLSLTRSAPVDWCRQVLTGGRARAIIVNAGNANAFTGSAGLLTVTETAAAVAKRIGCDAEEIFVVSTGIIGQKLAPDAIAAALPKLRGAGWHDAAAAIATTDTFPKGSSRKVTIDGVEITIAGIAKGSGMIAPDMATMLAFVFTDARISSACLQQMLARAATLSFNSITVDGDTSTSDTLLCAATGMAANASIDDTETPQGRLLAATLEDLCRDLAWQIVRDGEGATKFVTVRVTGARSGIAARRIALSIANSPLVKTAIAGEDANWGRIVMAVGKSGEEADRDRLRVSVGGVLIASEGMAVAGYDETPVAAHMKGQEIDIMVELGIGTGDATVWTCDLTHGYIDINGSYRS